MHDDFLNKGVENIMVVHHMNVEFGPRIMLEQIKLLILKTPYSAWLRSRKS
jgi:hypothetical protein